MNLSSVLQHRAFGVCLVVASIVALILSGFSTYQAREYNRCQSMIYGQLFEASRARSEAADQDRQSDRDESDATALLIRSVFTGSTTAERLAAYDTYNQTMREIADRRNATAKEREAHPLPVPPSQACS